MIDHLIFFIFYQTRKLFFILIKKSYLSQNKNIFHPLSTNNPKHFYVWFLIFFWQSYIFKVSFSYLPRIHLILIMWRIKNDFPLETDQYELIQNKVDV